MINNVIHAAIGYYFPNDYQQLESQKSNINVPSINSVVTADNLTPVVTVKNTNLLFTTDVEPTPIYDIKVTKE